MPEPSPPDRDRRPLRVIVTYYDRDITGVWTNGDVDVLFAEFRPDGVGEEDITRIEADGNVQSAVVWDHKSQRDAAFTNGAFAAWALRDIVENGVDDPSGIPQILDDAVDSAPRLLAETLERVPELAKYLTRSQIGRWIAAAPADLRPEIFARLGPLAPGQDPTPPRRAR